MIEKMQVVKNTNIAKDTFECVLKGELVKKISAAGQFLQIKVDGVFLRRPISISSFDKDMETLTIIYKVLGEGTKLLSKVASGATLDCLGPLGNGFDLAKIADVNTIAICGGGIGVPPLFGLAQLIKAQYPDKNIQVFLGFQEPDNVFYKEAFEQLYPTTIVIDRQSMPKIRNVVDALQTITEPQYIFACGPGAMLHALETTFPNIPMQNSYEERMACGVGVCMGCVKIENDGTYKRICKDGPVLTKGVEING